MKRRGNGRAPRQHAHDHSEHLTVREEHSAWIRQLQRWRSEHLDALRAFAQRMLPGIEIREFEDELDRHEAAINAHEDLVSRHEQMIQAEKSGIGALSEEYEDLHNQLHERHELSREQHARLARAHQAILEALATTGQQSER